MFQVGVSGLKGTHRTAYMLNGRRVSVSIGHACVDMEDAETCNERMSKKEQTCKSAESHKRGTQARPGASLQVPWQLKQPVDIGKARPVSHPHTTNQISPGAVRPYLLFLARISAAYGGYHWPHQFAAHMTQCLMPCAKLVRREIRLGDDDGRTRRIQARVYAKMSYRFWLACTCTHTATAPRTAASQAHAQQVV